MGVRLAPARTHYGGLPEFVVKYCSFRSLSCARLRLGRVFFRWTANKQFVALHVDAMP